ncbi:MAG TPA: L-erythro-3,5-diaminohexanoate dehydrogenase [Myxococcales bacterium]|nr:L-erythro-3,5-diaminohexanoate dehydrogenase [Myxococcales bacterium]
MDPYGLTRVVGQPGVLPQAAARLDPSLPCREDELLLDVERLNVDAASFRQLRQVAGDDPARVGAEIARIVRERGKLQNPVTGSGGMLLGRVREVGPRHPARGSLFPGDRVATLVSLTLTPLALAEVRAVDLHADRVDVTGHAILFATGLWAKVPADLPEPLVLALLDVCGAPALVARHVAAGDRVLVIGAGKSGALCCAQAKRSGARQVLAADVSRDAVARLERLGLAEGRALDATRATDVHAAIVEATGGALCDLVVNVASVPGTEMASLLSVRDGGKVIFFSMATSFTAAALGAEGIGKDATLLIGNGYSRGHADLTLDLVRREPGLRALLEERFRA